ncbi:MAG: hypothetical protein ACREOS_11980, partial [Candidatus Dormibacteraceae bacterium]
DALALTVQAPFSPVPYAGAIPLIALLICLIVVSILGIALGRWLRGHGRSLVWAIPLAIGLAVVSAIVVATASAWNPSTSPVPDSQLAWTYDYGRGSLGLFLAALAFLATPVVTPLAAFAASRKGKRVDGAIATSVPG